jgi:hypothetical protein
MDAVLDHPAPLGQATSRWPPWSTLAVPGGRTGGTFALRLDLSDELGPSPGTGGLLREIDRGPIAVLWGWPVQAGAPAQCRRLTVPLPSRGVPGALSPGVTNSPGISRTAPDHPRKPAAAALPERLWLTCL